MSYLLNKFKELFRFRELLFRLALKELKVRYKHPLLGFLWAFIVPFSSVFIFIFIFSYLLKISPKEYSFFVFLASAIFPWNYLNLSIATSTMSLLEGADLIKKVYIPRQIIPISIVIVNLVLFIFGLGALLLLMVFSGVKFTPLISLLPIVIFIQTIFISGFSLIVSSLQVKYRDVKYIVEILFPLWFYLTPIFYPLELAKNILGSLFNLYMLNPLTQQITLYRLILVDGYAKAIPGELTLLRLFSFSLIISLIVFLFGFLIFRKLEYQLPDLA